MTGDAGTCAWAVGTNVLLQDVDRLKKPASPWTSRSAAAASGPDGCLLEWTDGADRSGTPGSLAAIHHRRPDTARLARAAIREREGRARLWREVASLWASMT